MRGVSLVSMYQPWERLTHALLQFPSAHGKEAGVGKPKHEAVPSFFQWLIPHYPSALVSWCEPLWEPLGAQAGISSHLSPTLQSRAPWLGLAQFHRSRARPGPNPTEPRAGLNPIPQNPELGPPPTRCWLCPDPGPAPPGPLGTGSGSQRPQAPPAGPRSHREKPKRRCQRQAEQTRPGSGGCGCPHGGLEWRREGGGGIPRPGELRSEAAAGGWMGRGMPRLILLPAAGYLGKNQGDRAQLLASLPAQLAESRPPVPSSLCSGPALGHSAPGPAAAAPGPRGGESAVPGPAPLC